ncbi:MAG: hypothetical protein ABIA77_03820, partial [Candidatus Omnitrophota bacterium]
MMSRVKNAAIRFAAIFVLLSFSVNENCDGLGVWLGSQKPSIALSGYAMQARRFMVPSVTPDERCLLEETDRDGLLLLRENKKKGIFYFEYFVPKEVYETPD